jgi:putative flippase GtrA
VRERLSAIWARLTPGQQRFVRFGVVGASGVIVNLAFMALGLWAFGDLDSGVRDSLGSALGIGVSVLSNFVLNDAWTWGDRAKGGRKRDWLLRLTAYGVGSGVGAGLQFATSFGLRTALSLHVYLAQILGILLGMVMNFFISNRVVFRDKAPTTE